MPAVCEVVGGNGRSRAHLSKNSLVTELLNFVILSYFIVWTIISRLYMYISAS